MEEESKLFENWRNNEKGKKGKGKRWITNKDHPVE